MDNMATQPQDQFSALKVFDRLEVGPVKLERNRLTAPYRLFFEDKQDVFELIYSFEEPVFRPGESESKNLADMMAAQAALNYGLFCEKIVFHGLYDQIDRSFLRDMAENTAREIYVKKFLEPNPFLQEPVTGLTAQKKDKYLTARLEFRGPNKGDVDTRWQRWSSNQDRHCILSSGGKDSLLSYGLIDELGLDDMDRLIVRTILDKFGGGPVGLSSLAVAIGEESQTIEEVHEPYLIQMGFMKRTPQGRVVTALAHKHFGLEPPPEGQQNLL